MTSHALTSGYTPCACNGCFDWTLSSDTAEPELCLACSDADCDLHGSAGECHVDEHEPDCEGN